ncbi:MAG: LysR family transcriptional regulator [Xanthobacteraceae bacterium]
MDRMTSVVTFVKVVDSGGFAAASRKLNMSASTVTAHVQALEARLGVRLLNRSTRKISVTEVGHAYYERCLQILADIDDADSVVQALQSMPRGRLRLNASAAIPPLLAQVIAEFTALYPDVTISMTMSDRMVDLVEEGFDLAIRLLPIPDSTLVLRRVGTYRLIVGGAPEYLAARGIPQLPSDLVAHNCLSVSSSPWGAEWRFNGPGGEQSIQASGNLESNSANALRLAAVQGQGLTMMPSFLVVDEIKSGRLVPVLKEFTRTEYPINAIYPHRHQLSAKVRSFLDLMAKHYRENPAWADPCKSYPRLSGQEDKAELPVLSARPHLAEPTAPPSDVRPA